MPASSLWAVGRQYRLIPSFSNPAIEVKRLVLTTEAQRTALVSFNRSPNDLFRYLVQFHLCALCVSVVHLHLGPLCQLGPFPPSYLPAFLRGTLPSPTISPRPPVWFRLRRVEGTVPASGPRRRAAQEVEVAAPVCLQYLLAMEPRVAPSWRLEALARTALERFG